MPFVATKDGYRREGNLKRLLKVGSPVFIYSVSVDQRPTEWANSWQQVGCQPEVSATGNWGDFWLEH